MPYRALKADVDLTGLGRFASSLLGVIVGSGQEGDAARFVRTESGQLAWDISESLGPKALSKAEAKIGRDVKTVFFPLRIKENFVASKKAGKDPDFTWLAATPTYLIGASTEDLQPQLSGDDMRDVYRRANAGRGNAWIDMGNRGKQHVKRINRIVVNPAALKGLINELSGRIGKLRASFAFTANQLVPRKKIPAFVTRHFGGQVDGRAIYEPSGLENKISPSMVFGSTCVGVNSNAVTVDRIARATENRKEKIFAKLANIVRGYTYDWNSGRAFKPQVPKEGVGE